MARHSLPAARILALVALVAVASPVLAQEIPTLGAPTTDPVIKRIYQEGMQSSQAYRLDAPEHFARWMSKVPEDVWRGVTLEFPGYAHDESTDSDAFACRDAPGFFLNSADWDYTDYTWHTNRDTFDKISFNVIRRNATLIAMLAYEASEDPSKLGRERRVPAIAESTGKEIPAPRCGTPPRSYRESQTRGR